MDHLMADKIGFVPNVRRKDNVIQGLSVVASMLIGAGVGFGIGEAVGAAAGAVAGVVGGLMISGAILAIVGLVRRS
jgi:hypothetical protein